MQRSLALASLLALLIGVVMFGPRAQVDPKSRQSHPAPLPGELERLGPSHPHTRGKPRKSNPQHKREARLGPWHASENNLVYCIPTWVFFHQTGNSPYGRTHCTISKGQPV